MLKTVASINLYCVVIQNGSQTLKPAIMPILFAKTDNRPVELLDHSIAPRADLCEDSPISDAIVRSNIFYKGLG